MKFTQKRGLKQAALKQYSDVRMLETFLEFTGRGNENPMEEIYNLNSIEMLLSAHKLNSLGYIM